MLLDLDAVQKDMVERTAGPWRSDEWVDTGDSWSSLVSARQYRVLFDLVNRHVRERAAVLDWGSGSGRFSYALLTAGLKVSAYDFVEPPQLAALEEVGGPRFDFTLATEPVGLPFPDATFDVVTSVGVLEHVRETGGTESASLADIRRVLRPGGLFICCHLPNEHSWIDALARRLPDTHSHAFRYRRHDIEVLVRGGGLFLVEIRRYGALPRNRASALPARLRDTERVADLFDRLDASLGWLARPTCQNWAFVARAAGRP